MDIFDYSDYKLLVTDCLKYRRQMGKEWKWASLAHAAKLHTTTVSQVFNGERELSLEQAFDTGKFLELSELELDYFIALVQEQKVTNVRLKKYLRRKTNEIRKEGDKYSKSFPVENELRESMRSEFYSTWMYSGVRLATSLPNCNSVEEIATYLDLPKSMVEKIVEFLVRSGLVESRGEGLTYGPQNTHVPYDSHHAIRHHQNWRVLALEKLPRIDEDEVSFTCPMSISEKDFSVVTKKVNKFLADIAKVYSPSNPEILASINLDWLKVKK